MEPTLVPRPDTPRPINMEPIIDLRTPSFFYNHGGYYAPGNPRLCNTPGGPCGNCQERIDMEEAAQALLNLPAAQTPRSPPCCTDRPIFLEPCPKCNSSDAFVTHTSKGHRTCNGCADTVCTNCFDGARYYCPLRQSPIPPPPGPIERQIALGVQSPKAEEKTENKK